MNDPNPNIKIVNVLSSEAYKRLETLLPTPAISDNTTPLEVAHKLGIQLVLKYLREGFVIR